MPTERNETDSRLTSEQLAQWADILRDLAALGLHYSNSPYDIERYTKVQDIALEMLAAVTGTTAVSLEPLRASVMSRATPFAVGDGAVINDDGEILLIQRADNGKWAMPGGVLEVGETPAAGVVREILEETGWTCEAVRLIGVFDSRYCGTTSPHHLYQFLFLCRPLGIAQLAPSHELETLGMRWFAADSLPDNIDSGHVSRIPEAFRVWRGDSRAYFDE